MKLRIELTEFNRVANVGVYIIKVRDNKPVLKNSSGCTQKMTTEHGRAFYGVCLRCDSK